jgi:hypothetical protein
MIFFPAKARARLVAGAVIFLLLAGHLPAAETGPTLHFDYGRGTVPANPLIQFMYFVPLISPQPVSVFTNAGNTQYARVISHACQTNGVTFKAICEFTLTGAGAERNVIDQTTIIRGHEQAIKSGKVLAHQLAAINVEGSGQGSVEVTGVLTNGQHMVTEVCLRFNGHGRTSPVTIDLADFGYTAGVICPQNEMVARVNELAFHKKAGRTEMEVSLASVKAKNAADSFWQNFVGDLKGMAANAFLPPLHVTADGYQAMMNFGLALALEKPAFTFPLATRLEKSPGRAPAANSQAN